MVEQGGGCVIVGFVVYLILWLLHIPVTHTVCILGKVCMFVGCLTSQQHASVSHGSAPTAIKLALSA